MVKAKKRGPRLTKVDLLSQACIQAEREAIVRYLKQTQGNVVQAAAVIGIPRRTLEWKLTAHDLWSVVHHERAQAARARSHVADAPPGSA